MELKIEKGIFKKFKLEEISNALEKGLSKNYDSVKAEVIDCPNLRNWDCPSEGMSGNQRIIDVGGEPYMHDPKYLGTEFDYFEISKMIGSERSYALGAGSGAMSCLDGHCGELVINENFINWPIIGKWIWPNSFIGNTHDEEITYLKQWIERRLNWLDQHMGFL